MELFYQKLKSLEEQKQTIKVGLVGCGQMGSGMVSLVSQMPGLEVVAIAELDVERAKSAYETAGIPGENIFVVDNPEKAENLLKKGKVIVCKKTLTLVSVPSLQAVVEATGIPRVGAQVALECIFHQKHVIMLNVETEVTVGWILKKMADKANVVYTVSAGDEPGAIKELYNFASSLGFSVVAAGKGKNNPLDFNATPDQCQEEALKKDMSPRMLNSFIDGTKTMIEMTVIANATGLVPDVPGMHGPKVDVSELTQVLVPKEDGGILSRSGVVDYSIGNVAPGVFLIVTTNKERVRKDLKYYGMGPGPYYLLYRPYHLCSIETPLSVARAVLFNEPTLNSERRVAEVVTVAKQNLDVGVTIDGIGGYHVLGRIYLLQEARKKNLLPLGLAEGARVKVQVSKGECISMDMVEPKTESTIYQLWKLQESLWESNLKSKQV
ncbi:MAG: NAD(P)H-dependent oxidoreductase [bacterium]